MRCDLPILTLKSALTEDSTLYLVNFAFCPGLLLPLFSMRGGYTFFDFEHIVTMTLVTVLPQTRYEPIIAGPGPISLGTPPYRFVMLWCTSLQPLVPDLYCQPGAFYQHT